VGQYTNLPTNARVAEGLPRISAGLHARVVKALELFPCDILFVHRDAEGHTLDARTREVDEACRAFSNRTVPVVPVRMTEAWLLGSQGALRRAAENPNGRVALRLPVKDQWENIPDAKACLHGVLRVASELSARRLVNKKVGKWTSRVEDLTDDWSHLRGLVAFDSLEKRVRECLRNGAHEN